jgi:hypothetical protein
MKYHAIIASLAVLLLNGGCQSRTVLNEFTSDGCSLFPDGTIQNHSLWCECCFQHDLAYWRGGSEVQRHEADMALRACVLERTSNAALGAMMYDGVRAGGSPVFPTWYRWGYGWNYGRGYRTLSPSEQQQAQQLLARYFAAHPDGYCHKP